MKALFKSALGTDVVLRAVGICLVVLDHATSFGRPPRILAGLNMLLLVAGYSFARFLPRHPSAAHIRASLFAYGKALATPCFLALLASAVVYQKFSPPDLLFIGNWFSPDHVAFFPAWYPMELLQYLVLLEAVFSLPQIAALYVRSPFLTALTLLVFAVGQRVLLSKLWSAGYFNGQGPHVMLWNFMAGWLLFTARAGGQDRRLFRIAAFLIITFFSWATWGLQLRFWTTVAGAGALMAATRLTAPFVLSRLMSILSQAALTIFLFHIPMLQVFNSRTGTSNTFTSFLFAMTASTLIWIVSIAAVRAYRSLAEDPAVSATPAGRGLSATLQEG